MELPAGTGAMFARGLKRKCVDPEEAVEGALAGFRAVPSYSLQRQSLLDMSLVKLQLCHMLVEPNLCRSVLIANTVRQIQEEMSRDGAWHGPAPPCTGRAPLDHLVSTEILCRAGPEPPRDSASSPRGTGASRGRWSRCWRLWRAGAPAAWRSCSRTWAPGAAGPATATGSRAWPRAPAPRPQLQA